jgi:hypothetical protein
MIDESIDYFGRRMIPKAVVLTEMCLRVILVIRCGYIDSITSAKQLSDVQPNGVWLRVGDR